MRSHGDKKCVGLDPYIQRHTYKWIRARLRNRKAMQLLPSAVHGGARPAKVCVRAGDEEEGGGGVFRSTNE